ncbi:response regulator [Enterocloster lavalensis]|mgnify:FL=1|uniref:response regulator n=1 Tax=Enterocloster lavalensis TaxID=460384 RepID=UPI0023F55A40|nr:response regulator [Enterocloster lavalensis]
MGKKILIVDDAMFMRKMIRKILEEDGYTDLEEAQDGEAALELFEPFDPDLVLLDITMPGKSGLEVLEELLARRPQTKVVMCSAVGQESTVQQALTLGALDFIVKPFKPDEFKRTVAHYLR